MPPESPLPIDTIRPAFAAEGLSVLAVADATPDPEAEASYERWLAEGRAGEMGYMHRHLHAKYRPERMLEGARSIILVGLGYYLERQAPDRDRGLVSRYARGRDYHKTLGKRLKRVARRLAETYPAHSFRGFTDATPLSERHYAARAGLGFRGRNTLIIHPELGSWFFIGEILTSLALEATEPDPARRTACPTRCRRCIENCPTGALSGPYELDARLCISYLTIEYDGPIEPALAARMGTWVFGCDDCQDPCPLNAGVAETTVEDFRQPISGDEIDLALLLALKDDDEVRERFAGSPLLRAGRRKLVRNACIAAANAGARELLPRIRERVEDNDPVVAQTAAWAAARLSSTLPGRSR